MKATLFFLFSICALVSFGQTTSTAETDTALARRLLDLADTCFDYYVFDFTKEQATEGEARFNREIAEWLQLPKPDTLALAAAYRRRALCRITLENKAGQMQDGLASLRFLQTQGTRAEAEIAKSYELYGTMLIPKYDSVLTYLNMALAINRRLHGQTAWQTGLSHVDLARSFNNMTKYEQALPHADSAIHILKQALVAPHPVLARALFIRGLIYRNTEDYDLGIKDLREAEANALPTLGVMHPGMGSIYNMLGRCFQFSGDVDQAFDFLLKTLTIREKTLGFHNTSTAYLRLQLGQLYLQTGDFDFAKKHIEQALESYALSSNGVHRDVLVFPIELYARTGDFAKEAETFELFRQRIATEGEDNHRAVEGYQYHAVALSKQQRWEEAIEWLDRTAQVAQKLSPGDARQWNEFLVQKANCLVASGRLGEGISVFEQMLQNRHSLASYKSARQGLAKAYFEKFKENSHPEDLELSWENYLLALHTLDSLRYGLSSEVSRMAHAEANFQLFDGAIRVAELLGKTAEAFTLAEKSKAQTMLENLKDKSSRQLAALPDSLSEMENSLKSEVARLEEKYFEVKTDEERSTSQAALFDKKQALNRFVRQLENNFPNYFNLKYKTALAAPAELQNNLLDDATALLEYFLGDRTIYIFTLTKNSLELASLPMPPDFEATLETLRKSLTDNELRMTGDDAPLFAEASAKLYDWLLAEPLKAMPPQVKNLVIVPDGLLNYLPFEVLGKTEGQPDFKTFPYLLRNFTVSYATSANLLLEQSTRFVKSDPVPDPPELFAGFAPSYSDADTLDLLTSRTRALLVRDEKYALPGAAKEVQEIAAMLGGNAFLAADATEKNFKESAPRFRILHLAMHSVLEDRNPMFSKLLFTKSPVPNPQSPDDGDLNASELYNLRLPAADLAVLSACNTGAGKLRRGEGVMSLSRAFTYSGVPATVMSLWQAPDEATRQVMVAFYVNLKQGMRKDEALRQAKLTYLSGCKDAALASPFYWAGFVGSGEMGALFGK